MKVPQQRMLAGDEPSPVSPLEMLSVAPEHANPVLDRIDFDTAYLLAREASRKATGLGGTSEEEAQAVVADDLVFADMAWSERTER